jgi:hypothetical protein
VISLCILTPGWTLWSVRPVKSCWIGALRDDILRSLGRIRHVEDILVCHRSLCFGGMQR